MRGRSGEGDAHRAVPVRAFADHECAVVRLDVAQRCPLCGPPHPTRTQTHTRAVTHTAIPWPMPLHSALPSATNLPSPIPQTSRFATWGGNPL